MGDKLGTALSHVLIALFQTHSARIQEYRWAEKRLLIRILTHESYPISPPPSTLWIDGALFNQQGPYRFLVDSMVCVHATRARMYVHIYS